MKRFLLIGIATENGLFVSSLQADLESKEDQISAQKIIEEHMGEVDRILIVETSPVSPPAVVVNDFNAKDLEEE